MARSERRMAAEAPESSGRSRAVLNTKLTTDRTPPSMEKKHRVVVWSQRYRVSGKIWLAVIAVRFSQPISDWLGPPQRASAVATGRKNPLLPARDCPIRRNPQTSKSKRAGCHHPKPEEAKACSTVDAVFHPDQVVVQGKASLRGHHHFERRRVAKTDGFPCQPGVGCRR